jgi:Holliday junction resolvase RusA-like endonuclease
MVKPARDFKKMVSTIVKGKKINFNEKEQFISIEIYFYLKTLMTKRGTISKTSSDYDGLIKLIQDSVFDELGIDDSMICHAIIKKLPSNEDKTVMIIRAHNISTLLTENLVA